ncbi:glycoside hydrolase family 16 protein [Mycena rebaudengoi]|nr:glycoside hydrolase family 16 protein [Mycena rebaudengoi]
MTRSTAALGVLALAAVATASSHDSFRRHHVRQAHAAMEAKRQVITGTAYYGYQNNTMTACGTMSKDTDMIIGVGPNYYGDLNIASSKCGQHITVSLASDPSKSIDVTLLDACEDCGGPGNVYLSTAAFKALTGGSLDAGAREDNNTVSHPTSSKAATPPKPTASSTPTAKTSASGKPTSTKASSTPSSRFYYSWTPNWLPNQSRLGTSTHSDGYKLSKKLVGQSFLDFFNYDSGFGDNGGVAEYVNGVSEGLAHLSGDKVILAVDDTPTVSARSSLRMVSKEKFNAENNNLFIFDIAAMPAVCGTWPAVWFTGANWPYDGEIDVVEGVSLYNRNIYSVHTGSGCTISDAAVSSIKGADIIKKGGTNCDANVDTAACGFSDKSTSTFGPGFNAAGGGVFALEFGTAGISMWFFQTGKVPSDITSGAPAPSTWGSPRMSVPAATCSPTTYFSDLMLVVDTNLAGVFTESVWASEGAGGQSKSCKAQTGVATAAEYVKNHGAAFGEAAQWQINGFYVYNK